MREARGCGLVSDMKLFLSGGGNEIESTEVDRKFIETIDILKPVLYIPIATVKHSYPECLEWLKGSFARFNYEKTRH